MCKEPGYPCHLGCGMVVAFPEYHIPHCRNNPANLKGSVKKGIEAEFTKAELAQIARGPVRDKPIGKKRSKMQRSKAPAGKAKR